MKLARLRLAALVFVLAVLASSSAAFARTQQEIPSLNGNVGSCRADFTVHDGAGKPIYNAKIKVTLHYGFFSLRKTELQVGTNSDGKARFTGLPNNPKKPLAFHIKSGTVSKTVTDDPSTNCKAVFDVTLEVR